MEPYIRLNFWRMSKGVVRHSHVVVEFYCILLVVQPRAFLTSKQGRVNQYDGLNQGCSDASEVLSEASDM